MRRLEDLRVGQFRLWPSGARITLSLPGVRRGWRSYWYIPFAVGASILLITPRHLGWHSISDSLWTEDSRIFMNQAYALRDETLVTPYQGYLHAFQRLTCLPLVVAPLFALPYLLFGISFGAYLGLIHVLVDRLRSAGLSAPVTAIAVAAVVFQPHDGEVYFSITNTQWIFGLALAVYICIPADGPISWLGRINLAVVSLTGPFSLLLAPILALQLILRRDWGARGITYLIVGVGAFIQASVLFTSDRIKGAAVAAQHWSAAGIVFLTFGARNQIVVLASAAFWILFLVSLFLYHRSRQSTAHHPFYLVLTAGFLFGTSIYSVSLWSDVATITPIGGGARYYFIPYALLFLSAFLSSNQKSPLLVAMILSVVTVCLWSFKPDARDNLQWPAFARFAAFEPGISLPVNPQWDFKPVWAVLPTTRAKEPPPRSFTVDVAGNAGQTVSFTTAGNCPASTMIGLEAKVVRPDVGQANLNWGLNDHTLRVQDVLMRYYPSGEVTMHFAVTTREHQTYFTFLPSINGRAARVESMRVFCMN